MIETAFIVLYGLGFIGGGFMAVVWSRVARRGLAARTAGEPLDLFCLVAVGLFVGSLGNLFMFGVRTESALRHGVDPRIMVGPEMPIILFALLLFAVSKSILMWAHDPSHRSMSWRAFALVSAAWIVGAPLWLLT